MLDLIKEIFSLLNEHHKRKLITLQILVLFMAFSEIAGVASIGPFMALIGNAEQLQGEGIIAQLYQYSGISNPNDFIFYCGIAAICALTFGALVSTITIWQLSMFGAKIGTDIGDRLFSHYMHQQWLFHTANNSSKLTKQISVESQRVTSEIIQPLLMLNAKIAMVIFISAALFLINPFIAVIGLSIFASAYLLLYKSIRSRITRHGKIFTEANTHRFKLMAEGFGGIKDMLLLGRQQEIVSEFQHNSRKMAHSIGINQVFAQAPRYFMELIAFGAIIFLVLYLVRSQGSGVESVLPILAIYALAGLKLLPAIQQIYAMTARIKGGIPAYNAIRYDLKTSKNNHTRTKPNSNSIQVRKSINLNNIEFTYPNKESPVLCQFSLNIPANKTIGLVGPSGSGKSTAIDIILGLIQVDKGSFSVDGTIITQKNNRNWQNTLGFVPQTIFLSDASIKENIALGINKADINLTKINNAIKHAHLKDLIEELPEGIETAVGERGIQLSGGQRQRIGIARALYHDAEVLILDEATSALDGITEKIIMDAIHDFSGNKTIIMIAHRLTTVKQCDIIYFIDNGKVVDQGSFDELMQNNPAFKKMALSH